MNSDEPLMQTLKGFLETAPKKLLTDLYKKHNPSSGLVQGAKVIQFIHKWASDKNRVKLVLKNLGEL